ncbi:MAG: S8 family serine peptidase [Verrucomicrobia bacterium]|nr:S8 family serine peptidase [Verrucomicrobiota bacterium]
MHLTTLRSARLVATGFLMAGFIASAADAGSSNRSPSKRTTTERAPAAILAGADLKNPSERARVVADMKAAEKIRYDAVLAKAAQLGVPVRKDGPGHQVAILHSFRGDEPIYRKTMNRNAGISSAANLVSYPPYLLNGTGIKVGVWDAGSVRRTHQEFTLNRVTNVDAVATDDHSTHVAGTISAAGISAAARGMATNVFVVSYDWNSDYAEMTSAGAATATQSNKVPISNHSYGYDAGTSDMGVYNDEAVTVDSLLVGLPYYLPFWAAGNEQDLLTSKGGYQSITYLGLAKNLITIGAVNDAVSGTNRSLGGASIAYFSSLGPSDDGRIKPDIVANGIDLYSTIDTSDTAYDSYSGTSMATPSAAGSSALLAQLYQREFFGQFMRASMLKALLIHTADDLGRPGPDYMFGWGLINTKAAADVILAHKNSPGSPKMIEGTLTPSARAFTNEFTWNGTSPIRATLAWTDPAGTAQADNSRTPVLRNNLDLRIVAPDGSTVYQPYVMPFVGNWSDASMTNAAITGSNYVDNVERVDLDSPTQAGLYKVVVSYGGTLATASQVYSLVLTGGTDADQAVIVNAGLDLVSESCGAGNGVPDPGEVIGLTLALRNFGTQATTNLIATLLATGGVSAPSAAQDYGSLATDGVAVTNAFSFTADGECGGSITVTFALTDGTNDYGTISQSYTLGEQTAVTVTNANVSAITLNDDSTASPYPSTIQVAGLAGTVSKITVTLVGFSHTYPSDLDIVLTSPDGRRATLLGAAGGDASVSGLTITFDDDAEATVGTPMTSGTFKPSGNVSEMPAPAPAAPYTTSLSEFIGGTPNGTWSLYAVDAAAGDSGSIASGWRIAVTAGEPICCASNQPPGLAPVAPQTVPVGENLSFPVVARDLVDGDTITLAAMNLPAGATFPTTNGIGIVTNQFVWNSASPTGNYTATFMASDKDGTNFLTVLMNVFLPPPFAPTSIWASTTNGAGFTATWDPVPNAASYRLDVATNDTFTGGSSGQETLINEGFNGGATAPEGWTFTSLATYSTAGNYGDAPPSLKFDATADRMQTPALQSPTNLSFWVKGQGTDSASALLVEGAIEGTWTTVASFVPLPTSGTTLSTPVNSSVTNIRFTYTKSVGNLALDDVLIVADATAPSYVPGYSNLMVSGTSQVVGGLAQGVTYFFRARAVNDGGTSSNSPIASVTTTLEDTPPLFTSGAGPYTTTTGVEVAFAVTASGYPAPSVTLDTTTASGGYTFETGTLSYIPPVPDAGTQTFTFVASNSEGAATQDVVVVVTEGPPPAPASLWAAITNATDFTAAWNDVAGATSYRLDVSENDQFASGSTGGGGTEPFAGIEGGTSSSYLTRNWTNNGVVWTAYKARTDQTINDETICLRDEDSAYLVSGIITGGVDTLSIISQQKFTGAGGTFDVLINGTVVGDDLPITTDAVTHSLSNLAVTGDFTIMVTNSGSVRVAFDDLTWSSPVASGDDFLPGYSNLVVNGTNQLVSGLTPGATYYFRARSVNAEGTSPDSPVASVTTLLVDSPPSFGANPGPVSTTTGVSVAFTVSATGVPEPTLALSGTTASTGYTFNAGSGELTYIPPIADVGAQTFTFTATNSEGIATQTVSVIVADAPSGPPLAPAAIWASVTNATDFTAAWSTAANATSYRLDVSTSETFSVSGGSEGSNLMTNPGFETGDSTGWSKVESGYTVSSDSPHSGTYCIRAVATSTRDLAQQVAIPEADGLTPYIISYWYRVISVGDGTDVRIWSSWDNGLGSGDDLQPGTYNSTESEWTQIVITNTPAAGATNLNFEVRVYSGATVDFDDFSVRSGSGGAPADSYVPGYSNLTVATTSQLVTGLTEGVTYYLRARAVNVEGTSPNSPTASVVTAASDDGDINDDGIPDAWLSGHGFSPTNAAGDLIPGGGATFWDTYVYDVDPGNPPAGFDRIQGVGPNSAIGIDLMIPQSSTGRLYDIYGQADLLGSNGWVGLSLDIPGNGGPLTLTVTNNASSQYHYRTGAKLP